MSIKSAFWAVRYGLSFSDAGLIDDALKDTAGRRIWLSEKPDKSLSIITCKRMSADQPIRGNVCENGNVYAISKDSLNLVQSPLLKTVLKIILGFNRIHGGRNVSANSKAWRKDYDQQRRD